MTGPRTRRGLLQSTALALVGTAGCTGGLDDDAADDRTTSSTPSGTTRTTSEEPPTDQTTDETTTTLTEPPLAVEDVQIQSSFFYNNYPDAAAVAAREGTQFVFVELELVGSLEHLPSPDEIALVTDDRRFEGTLAPGSSDGAWELREWEQPYGTEPIQSGWVAFEVPAPLDADQIALTYESGGRTFLEPLDSETVEALARPPAEFEVVAFDYPESVQQGESFEVSVVVENTSEVDGVFRAVLNQSRPSYTYRTIEMTVPPDERREWTQNFDYHSNEDVEEARFTLLTPVGKREATIEVVPETTTA